MTRHDCTAGRFSRRALATALACGWLFGAAAPAAVAGQTVYRWIDKDGVMHLSSARPPEGVSYERLAVGAVGSAGPRKAPAAGAVRVAASSATPEQVARREAVISELKNRECVVALESMDRLARSGRPVEPVDFRRLQQTAELNCSPDPATRRDQEEQAARLRVAKGDACVEARNALADLLAPGRRPNREQLKTQQEFIETHCRQPVR